MPSNGGSLSGVGGGGADPVNVGDIVVSRIAGPIEAYVIHRIYTDSGGNRRILYLDHAKSRETAIQKAYGHRTGEQHVWLFGGPDDQVYSRAPEPPH